MLTFFITEAPWERKDLQWQADSSLPHASIAVQSFSRLPWGRTDLNPDLHLPWVSIPVVLLGKRRYGLLCFEETVPVASENLFKASSLLARVRRMQKQLVITVVTGYPEYLMISPLLLLIGCPCPSWDLFYTSVSPKGHTDANVNVIWTVCQTLLICWTGSFTQKKYMASLGTGTVRCWPWRMKSSIPCVEEGTEHANPFSFQNKSLNSERRLNPPVSK